MAAFLRKVEPELVRGMICGGSLIQSSMTA